MRALSIRQPYAELILRGIKTAELRSRATSIVGERFYLYASKSGAGRQAAGAKARVWSHDLEVSTPPAWMVELAAQVRMIEPELLDGIALPRGVIVGSAVIERVSPVDEADGTLFRWHLRDVVRFARPRKPTGHPQPVWFKPF